MARPISEKPSWSWHVYARLLVLYPRSYLRRHRAEMLQNFCDLEDAAASRAQFWLLMGRDLVMSLASHFLRSRLGRYVIGVFLAWAMLFAVGYVVHGPTPGHPVLHVFFGFLLGMVSMYIATRLYAAS